MIELERERDRENEEITKGRIGCWLARKGGIFAMYFIQFNLTEPCRRPHTESNSVHHQHQLTPSLPIGAWSSYIKIVSDWTECWWMAPLELSETDFYNTMIIMQNYVLFRGRWSFPLYPLSEMEPFDDVDSETYNIIIVYSLEISINSSFTPETEEDRNS